MNIKRIIILTKTHFKVYTRVKQSMFFSIIFPLIFIGLFGLAFQEGDPANSTITIAMINADNGLPNNINLVDTNDFNSDYYTEQFLDILSNVKFEDNKTNIFKIVEFGSDKIAEVGVAVEKRKYKALLVIDEDFSSAVLSSRKLYYDKVIPEFNWTGYPGIETTNITLKGDPSLVAFSITNSVVSAVVNEFFGASIEIARANLNVENLTSDGLTTFDLIVPGLLVFAILNNLGTTASVAVRDIQAGQLNRLRLTKMKNTEYIISIILSQMGMAIIQVPIMFGTAMLFGFPLTLSMFVYGFALAMLINMSMTGIGVMLAGFSRDPSSVGGLAAIIGTPMSFLAGAFFSIPNPVIIPSGTILGDNSFGLYDFLPPTKAITAMRLLLIGRDITEVYFEFAVTFTLTIIYLTLGIIIYSRRNLRPQ